MLLWSATIFWLSSLHGMGGIPVFPHSDKVLHAGAYGLMALLVCEFLYYKQWSFKTIAWFAWGYAALYGISDEFHQSFVPGRDPDIFDWLADITGAYLAVQIWLKIRERWPLNAS